MKRRTELDITGERYARMLAAELQMLTTLEAIVSLIQDLPKPDTLHGEEHLDTFALSSQKPTPKLAMPGPHDDMPHDNHDDTSS